MARIRTIKPDFWTDEKLSECSLSARLVFIGLWSFADDEGRMEYQRGRIRMQLFPCGSVTPARLTAYLGELSERSLIRIYTVDGKEFLDVPNFAKHQRINRPTPSRLPPYSMSPPGGLREPSPTEGKGTGTGRELEGREAETAPGSRKSRKGPAKIPLPDDFALDDVLSAYATKHLPGVDPAALFESYRGKALAKGWTYANWRMAFQEFVRNCAPTSGHWAAGQYPKAGAGGRVWE